MLRTSNTFYNMPIGLQLFEKPKYKHMTTEDYRIQTVPNLQMSNKVSSKLLHEKHDHLCRSIFKRISSEGMLIINQVCVQNIPKQYLKILAPLLVILEENYKMLDYDQFKEIFTQYFDEIPKYH